MPTIKDIIANVVADKKVTADEWQNQLAPALKDSPRVASPEARAIVELWAKDEFEEEPAARRGMGAWLRERGYAVPDLEGTATPPKPSPAMVPDILASNVGEADADFDAVSALAGRPDAQTTIAVLDGGFDLVHPELGTKEWTNAGEIPDNGIDDDHDGLVDDVHGWDFANGRKDVSGDEHGTHVTGIATRGTDRVHSISCRVFEPLNGKEISDAIDYAAAHGARVMNMSFKVRTPDDVTAVKAAMERHPEVLFLKSAGNDGRKLHEGADYDPATYLPSNEIPNMGVVAASDPDGKRADYSNYGAPFATMAIRGSAVMSTVPNGGYDSWDGTSMATPNATAVAAKCLALDPALSPVTLKQLLVDTSDARADWKDLVVSGGLVNEGRAIRLAALTGLVRGGAKPEAAADQLKLEGDDRKKLLDLAAAYLAPPAPQPPAPAPVPAPGPTT